MCSKIWKKKSFILPVDVSKNCWMSDRCIFQAWVYTAQDLTVGIVRVIEYMDVIRMYLETLRH